MGSATPAAAGAGRKPWRRWIVAIHRDAGYLCAALTVVYAVSGIAVNHIHGWNPNYRIVREERRFEPIPVTSKDEMAARIVELLDLPGPPRDSFRSKPEKIALFYDGWSVEADVVAGKAAIERPRERAVFADVNFLHLNRARGLWTWVADLYAVGLALLAGTGIFILKGRQGLGGRGKWLVAAGLGVPLAFLLVLRWI